MKKNHEIRFKCSIDLKKAVALLHEKVAPELKRVYFYEKIFLLGFNELQKQLLKKIPSEILMELLKGGRKIT